MSCYKCKGPLDPWDLTDAGAYRLRLNVGSDLNIDITFPSRDGVLCRKCMAEALLRCKPDEEIRIVNRFEEAWNG